MDGFSVASLTSHCTNISHAAISAAAELSSLSEQLTNESFAARLITFCGSLEEYGHTASGLNAVLQRAGVISQALQSQLTTSLEACQASIAGLNKQFMRLDVHNATELNWEYLVTQRDLLVAYTQLFGFFEELLGLDERDTQDSILDGPDGRRVISQVDEISGLAAKLPSDIFSSTTEPSSAAPAFGTSSKAAEAEDLPPPYEATTSTSPTMTGPGTTTASSSQPQPPPSTNPLDFSSLDLSTLKHSFRALTSRLSWFKPDPLAGALCEASRRGDVQQIAGLLQQGANIDGRNEDGLTPLTCAIAADQEAAARMLLSSGADTHSWSKWPPLFAAAHAGSLAVAGALIERGARPTETSTSGHPYFYDLINNIGSGNGGGGASLDGIRFLLERGANSQAQSLSGRRVIVAAAKKDRMDVVKLLLDFGASAKTKDNTGNSLLSIALDQPDGLEMAQLLLNRGADPNSSSTSGEHVVSGAIARRNVPFAKLLLAAGGKASGTDISGQPIIINAIRDQKLSPEDKTDLVRELLNHGASAKAKDMASGNSALYHAMDRANADIVSLLLQRGADGSFTWKGQPLILHAIQSEKTGMVEALLKNGVSPNISNNKGSTPLMQALIRHDLTLIKLLIRHGADVDIAPQEFARALGNPDVLKALGLSGTSSPFTHSPGARSPATEAPPGYNTAGHVKGQY